MASVVRPANYGMHPTTGALGLQRVLGQRGAPTLGMPCVWVPAGDLAEGAPLALRTLSDTLLLGSRKRRLGDRSCKHRAIRVCFQSRSRRPMSCATWSSVVLERSSERADLAGENEAIDWRPLRHPSAGTRGRNDEVRPATQLRHGGLGRFHIVPVHALPKGSDAVCMYRGVAQPGLRAPEGMMAHRSRSLCRTSRCSRCGPRRHSGNGKPARGGLAGGNIAITTYRFPRLANQATENAFDAAKRPACRVWPSQ